jgi:hypothetical protein
MLYLFLFFFSLMAAYFGCRRFQRSASLFSTRIDAPKNVRDAAKRLRFVAQPNVHSIVSVSVNSPQLCVTAMASAFAQMDDTTPPSDAVLLTSIQKHLALDATTACDMVTMGAWLVQECGGPSPAFERLTKRLKQLDHGPYFGKMMNVIGDVKATGTKGMPSPRQADAMGMLARIFRTA